MINNFSGMDLTGYLNQGRQATQATQQLQQAVANLTQGSVLASAALNKMIPLAAFTGLGKFAQVAADAQSQMAGLRATSSVTGQSINKLSTEADRLARAFPVGNAGARQLVASIQNLGISGEGSEKKIGALGDRFIKLGAATGESAQAVGTGVVQLSRAFGNMDLNPKQLDKLGDSLVTVQAKMGGSATSITNFAQSISPFARQAGLSAQATLGIAGAFQKLGDDSGAAQAAVGKMLSDMNSAVRDGGPQMLKYASIVGMTTSKFQALVQQNPGEALSKVTKALGGNTARSQRDLESLGLGGYRVQRALQEMVQSGGIEGAIDTATSAAPGTADKAAGEALHGLNDDLGKLEDTATQLAERLGAPVLEPLAEFAQGLTKVVGLFNGFLGSGIMQTLMRYGAIIGIGLGGARLLTGGGLAGIGVRAANNLPAIQALRAGRAVGAAGGLVEAEAAAQARLAAATPGLRGRNEVMRANRQIRALAYARQLPSLTEGETNANLGVSRYLYGMGAGTAGGPGAPIAAPGVYQDSNGRWRGPGGRYTAAPSITQAPTGPVPAQDANGRWRLNGRFVPAPMPVEEPPPPTASPGRMRMAGRWGGMLGGGYYNSTYGSLANLANSPDATSLQPTRTDPVRGQFSSGLRNSFTAMQSTGENEVRSFGQRLKDGGSQFSQTIKGTNDALKAVETNGTGAARALGDAKRIGGGLGRAGLVSGASGLAYGGSMLASMGPQLAIMGAITAGTMLYSRHKEAQAKDKQEKEDFASSSVNASMDALNTAFGRATGTTITMADAAEKAANRLNKIRVPGDEKDARHVTDADVAAGSQGKASQPYFGTVKEVTGQVNAMSAGRMSPGDLEAVKIDLLRSGRSTGDVEKIMAGVNTSPGGMSTQDALGVLAPLNRHELKAGKLGDDQKTAVARISNNLSSQYDRDADRYGPEYADAQRRKAMNTIMQAQLAHQAGPTGLAVTSELAKSFNTSLPKGSQFKTGEALIGANMTIPVTSVTRPALKPGDLYTSMTTGDNRVSTDSIMAQKADLRTAGENGSMFDLLKPGSAKSMNAAVNALIDGAKKAGTSMMDFSGEAARAAANLPQDTPEAAVLQAASQQAFYSAQQTAPTQGAQMGLGILHGLQQGSIITDSPDSEAQRKQDAEATVEQLNGVRSMFQQRLQAQFQYQIQSSRSRDDFHTQTKRSEDDFNEGRRRSLRDFAKNIRRQAEDAAHAMYDPYHRIGVEALWDSDSLMQNLKDQQKALDDQIGNLGQLRGMGMSNQAIQQLGLADSSHAQEAAELVQNLMNDPKAVAALNAQIAARVRSAGRLNQDAGNPAAARQREDFQQSLADQNKDFDKAQTRANDDFKKGMNRAAQDLHNSQLAMTQDFGKLQDAMNRLMNGQAVDFKGLMSNTLDDVTQMVSTKGMTIAQAFAAALQNVYSPGGSGGGSGPTGGYSAAHLTGGRSGGGYGDVGVSSTTSSRTGGTGMHNDPDQAHTTVTGQTYVTPGTGTVYSGGTSTIPRGGATGREDFRPSEDFMKKHPANRAFNKQIAKSMMTQMGWTKPEQWAALDWLWTNESGWNQYSDNAGSSAYGIPQALPGTKMAPFGNDWRTNPATQIAWGLDYIRRGSKHFHDPVSAMQFHKASGWYGDGSIFSSPKVIGVGERGPEAVIPLNNAGTDVLSKAFGRAMSNTQARTVATSTARTHINYNNSTHVTDNSVNIEKAVLQPPNLDALAQQLRDKQRAANLTATQTRRK